MFFLLKKRSDDLKSRSLERTWNTTSNLSNSLQGRGLLMRLFRKGSCNKATSLLTYTNGLADVQEQRWRPLSLRTPFLSLVIAVTVALIIALEILLELNARHSGVLFAPDINNLAIGHTFAYLYLPTLVAVLYSLLWNWIDLDIRRLEPYHQMSKENGALAKDSLLLHYPFDFVAAVPLKSFKRRYVVCDS